MKQKKALIRIKGMQFAPESTDEDMIESIMMGVVYEQDGYRYIEYTEEIEGFDEKVSVILKFRDGYLEVQKTGAIHVTMCFEKDVENQTNYATPMGDLVMGIRGKEVHIEDSERDIYVKAQYSLDVNYEYLCDCHIEIRAEIKE